MKLTVEDNNSMYESKETLYFESQVDIESFIKKNSFDEKGRLVLCEYTTSLTIKDFPIGDVRALIENLDRSFGGDAARFSYKLEDSN